MKTWPMLALAGTLIFFFSAALPLISVQFILTFSINLFDIYSWLVQSPYLFAAPPEWAEAFSSVGIGLFLMVVLFPLTVIIGFVSVLTSPKLSLIAGFLGIIYSMCSILTILQLKSVIAQLGGPFGALGASFMQLGYGVYVSVLGALILLISYVVAIRRAKAS